MSNIKQITLNGKVKILVGSQYVLVSAKIKKINNKIVVRLDPKFGFMGDVELSKNQTYSNPRILGDMSEPECFDLWDKKVMWAYEGNGTVKKNIEAFCKGELPGFTNWVIIDVNAPGEK